MEELICPIHSKKAPCFVCKEIRELQARLEAAELCAEYLESITNSGPRILRTMLKQ